MPIRPDSRDEQAWQIFLTLLANRKPDENPLQLAQDAFRAADVAQPDRVAVVDHLAADELRAVLAQGAWAVHRALYRVTRGRLGLRPPTPNTYGLMRIHTRGRRSGAPRAAMLGYWTDGPNLCTLAMNGWGAPEPAWWLNLQAHPDATVDLRVLRDGTNGTSSTSPAKRAPRPSTVRVPCHRGGTPTENGREVGLGGSRPPNAGCCL